MNQYLKNLNKIEFVVTYACTGRCQHCSVGEHTSCGERIDPQIVVDAVRKVAADAIRTTEKRERISTALPIWRFPKARET